MEARMFGPATPEAKFAPLHYLDDDFVGWSRRTLFSPVYGALCRKVGHHRTLERRAFTRESDELFKLQGHTSRAENLGLS